MELIRFNCVFSTHCSRPPSPLLLLVLKRLDVQVVQEVQEVGDHIQGLGLYNVTDVADANTARWKRNCNHPAGQLILMRIRTFQSNQEAKSRRGGGSEGSTCQITCGATPKTAKTSQCSAGCSNRGKSDHFSNPGTSFTLPTPDQLTRHHLDDHVPAALCRRRRAPRRHRPRAASQPGHLRRAP